MTAVGTAFTPSSVQEHEQMLRMLSGDYVRTGQMAKDLGQGSCMQTGQVIQRRYLASVDNGNADSITIQPLGQV